MTVIKHPSQLPGLADVAPMPLPSRMLMCPPDAFAVIDVKNPFMQGNVGRVDLALARQQWQSVQSAFEAADMTVELIAPHPELEDMVFCANQTLVGLDAAGQRVCIPSHMKHTSRRQEVPLFVDWFREHGYQIIELPDPDLACEGSGDLLWHPGQRLLYGGHGHRTSLASLQAVAQLLSAPVIALELVTDQFYHLDTCLCLVDEHTALLHSPALSPDGRALLASRFRDVIEVHQAEATTAMACNATACRGRTVIIQRGAPLTVAALRERGLAVVEIDTSEFMKSGGSVFCLKQYLY